MDGAWEGVLLTGPSGAGKSDLTLRLLEEGWTLVADDRVQLWTSGGRLYARAPDSLAGLLEARGLDVARRQHRRIARIALIVECQPPGTELERIPERSRRSLEGVAVETFALSALEASAPAKVTLALVRATERRPSDQPF
jgi:serine kinase of HPr protein (carbohydrate metabolism regulator)